MCTQSLQTSDTVSSTSFISSYMYHIECMGCLPLWWCNSCHLKSNWTYAITWIQCTCIGTVLKVYECCVCINIIYFWWLLFHCTFAGCVWGCWTGLTTMDISVLHLKCSGSVYLTSLKTTSTTLTLSVMWDTSPISSLKLSNVSSTILCLYNSSLYSTASDS